MDEIEAQLDQVPAGQPGRAVRRGAAAAHQGRPREDGEGPEGARGRHRRGAARGQRPLHRAHARARAPARPGHPPATRMLEARRTGPCGWARWRPSWRWLRGLLPAEQAHHRDGPWPPGCRGRWSTARPVQPGVPRVRRTRWCSLKTGRCWRCYPRAPCRCTYPAAGRDGPRAGGTPAHAGTRTVPADMNEQTFMKLMRLLPKSALSSRGGGGHAPARAGAGAPHGDAGLRQGVRRGHGRGRALVRAATPPSREFFTRGLKPGLRPVDAGERWSCPRSMERCRRWATRSRAGACRPRASSTRWTSCSGTRTAAAPFHRRRVDDAVPVSAGLPPHPRAAGGHDYRLRVHPGRVLAGEPGLGAEQASRCSA